MTVGFEDAFTDLQSESVSLCLEFVNNDADMIYIYIYQNENTQIFNAFFRKDGAIKFTSQLAPADFVQQFLQLGTSDIDRMIELCAQYQHKCPNQIKMIYNVRSGEFNAHYMYIDPADNDINPDQVLREWINEEMRKEYKRKKD